MAGGLGDDRLDVDNSSGLVSLANGITYDGGDGSDTLRLIGATPVTSDIYSVGPDVGSGNYIQSDGVSTQRVFFHNLEPVIDLTVGPLTVNGTAGDDAINYSDDPLNPGNGLVSIDNFETISFLNKTSLTIDAGAGSDTINVNSQTNPLGLASVTVNGGDPTGSDTLIVNWLRVSTRWSSSRRPRAPEPSIISPRRCRRRRSPESST